MPLSPIEDAIEDIKAGKIVIVVDDADRENEGDLTLAAHFASAETVNFLARYGRGLICAPLDPDYFERLNIPMMVPSENNTSKYHTNFGISVGATTGVTTGISAADRARTVQVLVDPDSQPGDLSMPGHIFPLRARANGVLERRGHTEAAVDLARLAGLPPAGLICEVLNEDGTMARVPQLETFAEEHGLCMISIEDLVAYRRRLEPIVKRNESAEVPTAHGEFRAIAYKDHHDVEHLAMCMGDLSSGDILVRLHSACLTGDVFGSLRCDCGDQLSLAMEQVAQHGRGVVLYLAQEGRGIGLANKIKAYALQDQGLDTVEANRSLGFPDDARTYDVGAAVLKDLGIETVHLMTNNPNKINELKACGINVVKRVPHRVADHEKRQHYLKTKADKMGHMFSPEPGEER